MGRDGLGQLPLLLFCSAQAPVKPLGEIFKVDMKTLFVILPYIKTEKPFYVAGFIFRSNRDTEGLEPEEIDHLQNITSLFYLSDDEPVDEVVYTPLHLPDDRDESDTLIQRLRAAHTILTFLVTKDHHFDTYEQLSIYLVIPTEVYAREEPSFALVPGYSITINWLHWCEIAQGKRLYPPQPYPLALIPKGWYLSDLEFDLESDALVSGLDQFIRGHLLYQPEQIDRFETILRAMQWYNRSFSQFDAEEERIIHLAIAFETLFHEPGEPDKKTRVPIRDEIKTHLRGLFGEAPGLNNWVDQFYDERSRILHEGFANQLRFVAGDKRPTEHQQVLDFLVNYGRRVLRMRIINILHATLLAEEVNLNAWFIHDERRLHEICKQLKDETVPAEQRLVSVMKLVFDLEEHWTYYSGQREVELKAVHAAGKKLFEVYLEAYPDTEPAVRERLERIVNMGLDDAPELVRAYSELHQELSKGLGTYRRKYWPREPFRALAHFAKYTNSTHFLQQVHSLKRDKQQKE